MKTIQVQGLHHITLVGSTKASAIAFWQDLLGMPFIFEQPNLGKPDENHLYFDPGDGRLLTVFTDESRADPMVGRARPVARLQVGRSDELDAAAMLQVLGFVVGVVDKQADPASTVPVFP